MRKPKLRRYAMSYGYDVPHYADFVVEAPNQREAERIAREALADGRFAAVSGNACIENGHSERVFCSGKAEDDDEPLMDQMDGIEPRKPA